jgi:hypothetical protein
MSQTQMSKVHATGLMITGPKRSRRLAISSAFDQPLGSTRNM